MKTAFLPPPSCLFSPWAGPGRGTPQAYAPGQSPPSVTSVMGRFKWDGAKQ